jgi:alpha-L-fucosidase
MGSPRTSKALRIVAGLLLSSPAWAGTDPGSGVTDWFRDARYGIFMHFLPGDPKGLALVDSFDVEALARQLEAAGAKYFVITLGQNSGYFISPNAAYEKATGYAPGERCSRRDLPLDLHRALSSRGIRLMLYLPAQTPNGDRRAQKAFGLPEGAKDQPIDIAFARKWAEVIREWSDRYGDKVSGWWFDGCYEWVRFFEEIARIYKDAVRHGNPRAIVAFNPGVKVIRWTQAEDYTAGELNDPFEAIPASRWLDGTQWHALTFLGSAWSRRDVRHPTERWAAWVKAVAAREGVVTLDMGPNWDPEAGPIGSLDEAQLAQVRAVRAALGGAPAPSPATGPKRLPRADSFLGIHFDFHAGTDCTEIGKNTTREMIEGVIDLVRPDYIQIDCKGHPGLSSYPTKVGNRAPGFLGDPLRLWRQVTAERGVALYMHYSGVWDSEAIRLHPDWGAANADGKTNGNATSFFGPYDEKLLIPQLRELAGDYGVDGAWVDGECWASVPDFGEAALKAFREATGIADVPRKAGDPHRFEFLQFHREAFRNHLRRYIAEVKKTNPGFQICSNWAFTDHMPEPVSAPVDWISGDYSPQDSVNSARFSARYLARQGKSWDLMAWSFTTVPGKDGGNEKTAVQLEREAAAVLSLGGGFQAYFQQRRDGSVRLERMPVMAEVAGFCRARQAACHGAVPVPQVAVLYSTADHYRRSDGLFPRDLSEIQGTLQALLESQWSVEVLGEHGIAGRMAEYGLIVVPECRFLEPAFKAELLAYATGGGSLLLIGPPSAQMFRTEVGVALGEALQEPVFISHGGAVAAIQGRAVAARPEAKAEPFGRLQAGKEAGAPSWPAASIASLGKGKIAATYFPFSRGYLAGRPAPARAFLDDLARRLFPKPIVEVKGSPDVDVAVSRIGGRLAVNLVNTAGPHAAAPIIDSIPPVGPLEVKIRVGEKPAAIVLEPGGGTLPFEYSDGEARVELPRLEIHAVLVVR